MGRMVSLKCPKPVRWGGVLGTGFWYFEANFTGFRAEFEENLPIVVDFRSASG